MGIARRWDEMEYAAARTAREKEFLYWLTRCPGFGSVTVQKIWNQAESFESVYYIEGMELYRRGILYSAKQCREFDAWKKQLNPCGKNIITLEKKESGILRPGHGISGEAPTYL